MIKYTQQKAIDESKHYLGIDGCRGGWIFAWKKPGMRVCLIYKTELWPTLKTLPKNATILIDMILYNEISLKNKHISKVRAFDRFAKKELGKWHSRVFTAPPKDCLNAQSYLEACKLSKAICGKMPSIQCFNIFPKIYEANKNKHPGMREFHPEISFKKLNKGTIVGDSKKSISGKMVRKALIQEALGYLPKEPTLEKDSKTKWGEDDLLDALALLITAIKEDHKKFYNGLS